MDDNTNYIESPECGCGGVGTARQKITYADRWYVRCTKCGVSTSEYETPRQAIDAFKKAARIDIENEYRVVCLKLRGECMKRKLGLGGERLEDLLVEYLNNLEKKFNIVHLQ
jgi:hypothetical protein